MIQTRHEPISSKLNRGKSQKASPLPSDQFQDITHALPDQVVSNPTGNVTMIAVQYIPDTIGKARFLESPPFALRGDGSSGRLVDREGKVVINSDKEISILSFALGFDKHFVLVRGGNGVNFVLNPSTGLKIKLPITPPEENLMLAFEWNWIGEKSLLGKSGVVRLDKTGRPVKTDDNIERTMLYVFDLVSGKLTAIQTPKEVNHPVFTVVEAAPDGHIKLLYEEPHGGLEQELGWFKINTEH